MQLWIATWTETTTSKRWKWWSKLHCFARNNRQRTAQQCRRWSGCWKGRGWLRGGKNGRTSRLLVGKSMKGYREDLTGAKIPFITRMPLSCLGDGEVMNQKYCHSLFTLRACKFLFARPARFSWKWSMPMFPSYKISASQYFRSWCSSGADSIFV